MANIFITGGAGFIGSHTVDRAIADGHKVTVYDIKSWDEAVHLHQHQNVITYVQGDILDFEFLAARMVGHSHVLHLAAIVSVQETISDPLASHATNVTGTLNVFEAARVGGVSRVVYASSAAVYGIQKESMLTEDSPCTPLSPYGIHKLVNDTYAELYASLYGQSLFGLRYFNVYGLRQNADSPYSGVISIFTKHARSGQALSIYGDGSAVRDFVSVYDVARANVLALFSDVQGYCNIASGQAVSLNQLLGTLEEILGKSLVREYREARAGDIVRSCTYVDRAKALIPFESEVSLVEGLKELLV